MPRRNRRQQPDDCQTDWFLANIRREIYTLQEQQKKEASDGKQEEVSPAPRVHRAR